MANEVSEREDLQQELKKMQICRFCLSRKKLSGIFVKPANMTSLAPLSVQVMACASIEIFTNDGMPSLICQECRVLFEHSYRFKQMCKRADTILRQFPLTGSIPQPLERPKIPPSLFANATNLNNNNKPSALSQTAAKTTPPTSGGGAIKILNSAAAAHTSEVPLPMLFTFKTEPNQDEIHLLNKVDNDEEISMEDVQKIIANAGDEDFIYANSSNSSPPKLLNKTTKRILTVDLEPEPQFTKPKMQVNLKGNIEMVTAIVPPYKKDEEKAKDPVKNAEPVATDNFPCPFCERSFPLVQLRDIHLTRHNRERNFQCPDCDKSFFSKYDLQKHEVRHTGERPFKCQACDKSFTRLTLLHRHERVHTDIPKYLCMYCEKPFISKDELETHISRHEKNRPFKCQQCGKSFAFKQGLERHEVVHSAVLPYACQYCDQSFTTPSKLSRHLTAHAGDRPFPCKYCNKSYVLSHHLTRHLRSHKQEKSIDNQCTDCKKTFNTRESLIYHTAVHSTANLTCTLCQMKFKSPNEITEHIKLHIEGDTYACEFCDLIFLTAENLFTHYDEKHSKEVNQFKYNAKTDQHQQQKQTVKVIDGDDENVMTKVNEIFDSNSNKQQLTVLDGDDENVVATINEIFNYDDLEFESTAVNNDKKKDTMTTQIKSPEKPTIINQIVFSSNNGPATKKVTCNEKDDAESSAKMRKVIARNGKLQIVGQTDNNENTRSPRRKVAEKQVEIKLEKEDPIDTHAKLPTLPKGVTLRKSSATNNNPAAGGTSTEQKTIKKMTLAEAKVVVSEKRASETKKIIEKPATRVNTRRSGGNIDSNTNEMKEESPSTSKSSQKIQHIRMTKAMADELAKQGRIKFKGGNMVLTKSNK